MMSLDGTTLSPALRLIPFWCYSQVGFFPHGFSRFRVPSYFFGNSTGKVSLVLCETQPHHPVNVISQEILGAGRPDLGHMLWWVVHFS